LDGSFVGMKSGSRPQSWAAAVGSVNGPSPRPVRATRLRWTRPLVPGGAAPIRA